jgi:hypothetical protein
MESEADGDSDREVAEVADGEDEGEHGAGPFDSTVQEKAEMTRMRTTDDVTSKAPAVQNQRSLASLRSQRSFFDPTTASPRAARSQRNFTHISDSNGTRRGEGNEPRNSAVKRLLTASQRGSYSSPNLLQREMDPLLKELERRSRVGVRTVCATCGKKGLNFPTAAKGGATFCSRECRVKAAKPSAGKKENDRLSTDQTS